METQLCSQLTMYGKMFFDFPDKDHLNDTFCFISAIIRTPEMKNAWGKSSEKKGKPVLEEIAPWETETISATKKRTYTWIPDRKGACGDE